MQLTKQTDFAFRVLIYLATHQSSETLSQIQQISDFYNISKNHLMKVVQKLSNHGYILAKRGHQGGLKLGKNAQDITLREIVELIEQTLDPVNCMQQDSPCILHGDCRLKMYLNQAQEAFLARLEKATLADLLNKSTHEIIFTPHHVQTATPLT